jgi:hypothetical protein
MLGVLGCVGTLERVGAVEQRLAAQPTADGAGRVDGLRRGIALTSGQLVPGVVEQTVGEMVGSPPVAQAGDGRGEGGRGGLVAIFRGEPGAGQVALGAQHRDDMTRLVSVDQSEQLTGDGVVAPLVRGADGERPRPEQFSVAYPEDGGQSEGRASVSQRVFRLAASVGGEGLGEADHRLILGCFAGAQVPNARQEGIGGGGVAVQSREPSPLAGKVLDARQTVRVRRLDELRLGGIPVAEADQGTDPVQDRLTG